MAKKQKPKKKKDENKEVPFDELVGALITVPPKNKPKKKKRGTKKHT